MNDRFNEVADRLDVIAEELAECAMSELSSAIRRGDQKRPAAERALTQARRAIDKATHLLRNIEMHDEASDQLDCET